ncbi:MAG: metallophosphatase family protein [Treponema sp.]|jgi:predicted phosphodiesterase|nr:metallophosphatase family protein [Treponema sp.]
MRILVVSDIHANLAAFQAVLKETRYEREGILCLGDVVGYGPNPNECVELAAELCTVILGGNHDLGAAGTVGIDDFSRHARRALEWTQSVLLPANKAYLAGLSPKVLWEGIVLSHGGPEDPVWSYILSEGDAEASFAASGFSACFFGHTHLPSVFLEYRKPDPLSGSPYSAAYGSPDLAVEVDRELRMLLNPGSVGFPRDAMDAHASDNLRRAAARYALYDTGTGIWQFKRIEYDMRDTAKRMRKLGLW